MIIPFRRKRFTLSPTCLLDFKKVVFPILLLLIVASFIFLDKPLALFFNSISPVLHAPFILIERLFCPFFWALITPALFFFVRFIKKKEKKSRKFWYLSLAFPLLILSCKVLEVFLGKANPEWFFTHQEIPFRFFEWNPSFHSFPSMESTCIATFAIALSCILSSRARPYLLVAGFLLSLSPVISTHAFLSDALGGFALAGFMTQWIFQVLRRDISF
ncbi:MAG: phosphatase PAP2 family protein [Rhabdochlamydiaceae bacterium]|nr:phosphatase PAP2 family protein [Rhabdochlamydiaceae bacterium]